MISLEKTALLVLCLALGCAPLTSVHAASDRGFSAFCRTWMDKLQARESHNLRNLKLRKVRGDMVGEYTGYGRKAVRCEPNGKVGTLVYHEYLYRKAGKNRGAALKSKAKAVQAVEVMEIFRFDGKAWKY